MSSFFSNIITILYAGVSSFFSTLEGDITSEFSTISYYISELSYSWTRYFRGVWGPALMIGVILVSTIAGYAVFDVFGIGKDVVEEFQ